MTVNHLSDEEFFALYGRWATRTPDDVAALFANYPGLWWVAGGWAIEAFTGAPQVHDDIDPSVLRRDLPTVRRHLAGRLHLWSAAGGSLAPVLPEDDPDGGAETVLPAGCGQLWARLDAESPWEYDILLSPGDDDQWVYKRDERVRMPMRDALWVKDGVRYLQPEIQLLLKSRSLRPKDDVDFSTTLPHLDARRRGWLHDTLHLTSPDHPWIGRLRP